MASLVRLLLVLVASVVLGIGAALWTWYNQEANASKIAENNRDALWSALNSGATTVANCSYFKRMYPAAHAELLRVLRDHTIVIMYDETMPPNIFARAQYPNMILVTPTFLAEPKQHWPQIMAHELLHLAKLPPHKIDGQGRVIDMASDVVYKTTKLCYKGTNYANETPFDDDNGRTCRMASAAKAATRSKAAQGKAP